MAKGRDKSNKPFARIDTKEWTHLQDKKKPSSNALLVYAELLCGRDRNMIGFYQIELTWVRLSKRLGLERPDLEQAFKELQEKGLIAYDPDSEVVLVKDNFRHMPLTSMDVAVKAGYTLEAVPDNSLFPEFASMLESIIDHHREIEEYSKKPYAEEATNPDGSKRPAGKPSDWYEHLLQQLYEFGFLQENHSHNKQGVIHGVKQGDKHKEKYKYQYQDMEKEIKSSSRKEISDSKMNLAKNKFNLEMAFRNQELLDQYKDFWEKGIVGDPKELKRICQRFLETTSVALSSERWMEEAVKMFDTVQDVFERDIEVDSVENLELVIEDFMQDPPNGSKDRSICLFNQDQVKAICLSRCM